MLEPHEAGGAGVGDRAVSGIQAFQMRQFADFLKAVIAHLHRVLNEQQRDLAAGIGLHAAGNGFYRPVDVAVMGGNSFEQGIGRCFRLIGLSGHKTSAQP